MRRPLAIGLIVVTLMALVPARAAASGTADLAVSLSAASMSGGPTTYIGAGYDYVYLVTVTNNGPDSSSGPTIRLTLPAGATFVAPATLCAASAGVVSCALGAIAPGALNAFTRAIQVTAPPSGPAVASVTVDPNASETDPDPVNNTATHTMTVIPVHDLSVTQTASPSPVGPGGTLTYTVTVSNAGPSDATVLAAVDTIPSGTAFVSVSSSGATFCGVAGPGFGPNDYGCQWPSLAAGATRTMTVVVTVGGPGTILNRVLVGQGSPATEVDPNSANDTSTLSTTVAFGGPTPTPVPTPTPTPVPTPTPTPVPTPTPTPPPVGIDLQMTKTYALPYGTTVARIGTEVTYQLGVTDLSATPSSGFTIVDTVPAAVSLFDWPASVCAYVAPTLTCTGSGLGLVFTIHGTIVASGTITNTATVTGTTADPDLSNNTASATLVVAPEADLGVTVSGPATAFAGVPVTYTVTVTNSGPDTSTGGGVKNVLPAGATFVSASAGCVNSGTVVCTFGALAAGTSTTFFVTAQAPASGSAIDTVVVAGSEYDKVPANNTASITTAITPLSDLAVAIGSSAATATPGSSVDFTATLSNLGPSGEPIAGAEVTLSSGLTLTAFSCPGAVLFGIDPITGRPGCRWNAVPSGSAVQMTVTATVAAGPSTVSAAVRVGGSNIDPVTANDTASATVTVANTPTGTNVSTQPIDTTTGLTSPVTLTFSAVSAAGTTTITSSTSGPAIPAGFSFGGTYFELSTTAAYTPPITICFAYAGPPPGPRLFHYQGGAWVDVTTSVTATQICGQTTSLSPFALLTPTPAQLLADLAARVATLPIPTGLRTSLGAKLAAALRADPPATCGQLRAFTNEVRAQRGKGLTAAQAGELLDRAAAIARSRCP